MADIELIIIILMIMILYTFILVEMMEKLKLIYLGILFRVIDQ